MHEPPVFGLSAMRLAATDPLESVEPLTTAHSPTLSALAVVDTVVVYFVSDVTWTVAVVAVLLPGRVSATVIVSPEIAVTLPAATAPGPPLPARRNWLGAPEGTAAPPGSCVGRAPAGKDLLPSAIRPPVQLPCCAAETCTSVAVMSRADDDLAVPLAAAVATTQLPTLIAASEVARSAVNRVFAEYVTAVCSVLLCTCKV
jgi:hypothetical protein